MFVILDLVGCISFQWENHFNFPAFKHEKKFINITEDFYYLQMGDTRMPIGAI